VFESSAIEKEWSWEPPPLPGTAGIRAGPGREENSVAFLMKGEEIPPHGAAILDGSQRLSAPLQELLPQVFKGGGPASRSDLMKVLEQPWLQPLWGCPFRQQDMLLLSGINREKGE